MCNMTIWRRTGTHLREVSHSTNEHECLTYDDSNLIRLDGDCMPNVLIDNDDLSS